MKVIVSVTQNDIDYGDLQSATSCPIARAIGRRTKHTPSVGGSTVSISAWDVYKELPDKASSFIDLFDRQIRVKPFRFTLDLPKKCLKKPKAR